MPPPSHLPILAQRREGPAAAHQLRDVVELSAHLRWHLPAAGRRAPGHHLAVRADGGEGALNDRAVPG